MYKAHLARAASPVLLTFALVTFSLPALVRAAPADDVMALIKAASAAFAEQKWDEAAGTLETAESQAKAAGLANDKVMARVLIHRGAVLVAGADRPADAVSMFRRALKIDPGAKLTSTLALPTVLDAFKRAVLMERAEQAAGAVPATESPPARQDPAPPESAPAATPPKGGGEDEDTREPDLPADIPRPLHCPNPDEAPPRRKAVLRCVARPDADVGRVLLHYRLPGSEDYETVPATKTPRGWYVAVVPAKAFSGRLFQYYFEARDPTDAPLAENGRFDSPNLMIVRQGAPPVTHSAQISQTGEALATEDEEPEEDDPLARLASRSLQAGGARYWVALSVGRGAGFHGTRSLEWYDAEVSGASRSASLLHLWPEFGVRLLDHFALALQGRNQVIQHSGGQPGKPGAPAVGANSVLLRVIWFLPVGQHSNVQLSALAGGGEGFRLVVPPNEVLGRLSSDTVRGGPFLVGAGVHTDVGFGETWALRIGLEVLQGLPDAATAIDVGLGGVLRF